MTDSSSTNEPLGEYPRWMSRERFAWTVLLVAFGLFLLLLVTVPLAINWSIQTMSVAQRAVAQGTSGKTLIESSGGSADPVAIEAGRVKEDIVEGSVLRTDESQVVVRFFDRSLLTIFPNSTVTLNRMRQPRFGRSTSPNRIVLTVHSGRVRVQVAESTARPIHLEVHTPQALAPRGGIVLLPGSFSIETTPEVTHVAVRSGEAQVSGQTGQQITLLMGERAEIALGRAVSSPLPAKRNLLVNSDFQNPEFAIPISGGTVVEGWQVSSDQGGDGGAVDGMVEVVTTGTSRALHFKRENSGNNHGETAVTQQVQKVLGDSPSLALRFDVRLLHQSLSGGGEQSSEFPLIVRVDYKDGNGDLQHWTQGFYYQNEAGYNVLEGRGTEIPRDVSFRYEVDLQQVLDNPQTIEQIQFYASGWDWEGYVSEVELIAE